MSKYKLSLLEKILLWVTIIVISLSIILSLCIGLILPPNFIHNNKCSSETNLSTYCLCKTISKPRKLNCTPQTFNMFNADYKHPYLVSLSIHSKDDLRRRFACAGVIVSSILVLAGQDCLLEDSRWNDLLVRAGSMYWSKGGTLHKITRIFAYHKRGPVCFKVHPYFSFNEICRPVKLSRTYSWNVAYSPHWRDANINKNDIYYVEMWSKRPCTDQSSGMGALKNIILCDVVLFSKPLVIHGILVGFHVGVCRYTKHSVNVFIDFQNSEYARWITEIVEFGEPHYYGIFVKEKEVTEYVYNITTKCTLNKIIIESKSNLDDIQNVKGESEVQNVVVGEIKFNVDVITPRNRYTSEPPNQFQTGNFKDRNYNYEEDIGLHGENYLSKQTHSRVTQKFSIIREYLWNATNEPEIFQRK